MTPRVVTVTSSADAGQRAGTRNAFVCDTFDFEQPVTTITGKSLLVYLVPVVFALIVNLSGLRDWKIPIYIGLLVLVGITAYVVASRATSR
jgi:hypothetical protein